MPEGTGAAREHVAIVRSIYERWSEGDFQGPAHHFDPHVVFVLHPGFPEPGVYYGSKSLAGYTRGLLEPWERLTIEAEEISEVRGAVLAGVRQQGVGVHSGAVTELRYHQLWTLQGDRVVRFDGFRERAEALAAAGVEG